MVDHGTRSPLRCGQCTRRDRRGAAGQDGQGVRAQAAVERVGSHDHAGEAHRTATVEEDGTLPSAARVENAFFVYKSILGEGLRARSSGGQAVEAILACNVLNQTTARGKPEGYSIGR